MLNQRLALLYHDPLKPAHIRSRVHTWLRRKRAGREGP
jgi:hypothetical protein